MKQLAYNNKGQVQTSVSHSNTAAPVTTTFTYDDFGNVLTSSTSATGVENVSKKYEYDNTNRFVTYQRVRQQVLNYTYDQWGNMLTKTDNTRSSYPYTISYTYDNWGNLLSESLPTGQLTTYTRGWNPDGTTFFVTQGTGQPWTKTWYDKLGQKTRVQSISWLDTPEEETFNYNAKGQLIEHARITGSGTNGHGTFEEMQYDARGRLTSKVGTGQPMVNITYGNNTVTTTSAGRSVTRQSNLWGNVIQVTDTAGTVSYSYGSHGKPMSVSFGGNTVTMSYDVRGRQMKITDPDAGQNTFTYDAYDRVLTECDAQNNKHYYTYNAYGRLVRDSVGIYVTSYVYGNRPTNRGLLTSTHTGDCTIYYTYDEYGRRLKERRSYSGVGTWDETLSYNSIGQIASAQYSNGPTVTYTYDAYGYKDETRANGTLICKPQLHTGWEVIDKCGTNLVRHWNIDGDSRLSDIALYDPVTMMGHDQAYWYDSATGNLEERWGMFSDNEIFYYDALDRLTHVYCTPGGPDVTSYAPNGNITSQTGIGSYYYQGTKPHAVSGVDNTNGQIPLDNQTIYWNSLGKVSSVVGGGYTQSFDYGPDGQRWKSRLLQGSTEKRVVYYMGNCEQVQQNGNTRRLYFLDGGAIYVKQDNKPDSIWFMFTDRQSSVTAIVDYAGNELFCASYDAWGRQTVEHNDIGFHRGYTGHEMMPEFGLINMNGRLYDPLVCRFVSPDPYIQAPFNSQNFNRYSYCLNNPLKYTDPSGEVFGIDDAIIFGILVGVYVGGVAANKGQLNPLRWDYTSSQTYLGMFVGGVMGGFTGYGLANPGAINFMLGISTPWGNVGVSASVVSAASVATVGLGKGTDWRWNFHWSTAFGGGGSTEYSLAELDAKVGKIYDDAVVSMRETYETFANSFDMASIHTALDAAGTVFEPADAVNALLYGVEGDYLNAGLCAVAMVPILGNVATAGKVAVKGYKSYPAFIRDFGKAGDGMNWHHIVEQNPANIKKFGQEMLQNTHNIIRIPGGKGSLHARISGHYSSKPSQLKGLTVRQWLNTKSFEEQYEYGIKMLKEFGWE